MFSTDKREFCATCVLQTQLAIDQSAEIKDLSRIFSSLKGVI